MTALRSVALALRRATRATRRGLCHRPGSNPAPPRWESPRWESPVALFSSLRLRAACRVSVLPLDLHGYPDGDRAFVRVFRERGSEHGARQCPGEGTGQGPREGTGQGPREGIGQCPGEGIGQGPVEVTGQGPVEVTGQGPVEVTGQGPVEGIGQGPREGIGQGPVEGSGNGIGPQSAPAGQGSALGARGVSVDYSDSHKRLQVTGNERAVGYQLEVTVPIKFDLDLATSGDGGVHVGSMESDVCSVRTDRGGVHLASIKGADISVESEHGNVSIGSLQGNVNIHARGCNSVNIDKLQAIKACVSTKRGPLNAKFIYAESSQFSSTSGTVNLGSTHGNTVVTTDEGHIVIESLDGGLVARTRAGDVTVHLSQPSAVDLYSERGDVNIKFPDSLGLEFLVTGGKGVVVSPDVHLESMELSTKGSTQSLTGRLSKGGMLVRATSKHGTVRLQRQSWFQSLGLKGK
ncbi:protein FAM185A [Petromyzon marinus]|uniref:protein FAM185A n=1 Tax=Petromyzon marinus TaxID=7757 RepID=UPI003F724DEE